jgi:hypothetical protein
MGARKLKSTAINPNIYFKFVNCLFQDYELDDESEEEVFIWKDIFRPVPPVKKPKTVWHRAIVSQLLLLTSSFVFCYSAVSVWPPANKVTYLISGLSAAQVAVDLTSLVSLFLKVWLNKSNFSVFLWSRIASLIFSIPWLIFVYQYHLFDDRQSRWTWAITLCVACQFVHVDVVATFSTNDINKKAQTVITAIGFQVWSAGIQIPSLIGIFLHTDTIRSEFWYFVLVSFFLSLTSLFLLRLGVITQSRWKCVLASVLNLGSVTCGIIRFFVYVVLQGNQEVGVRDVCAFEALSCIIPLILNFGWAICIWNFENKIKTE